MMSFGCGRWDSKTAFARGRHVEHHPQELITVAHKFTTRFYVHARPDVECNSV